MIDIIAKWAGFAGIIVSLVAVIILFLTRQNILDILDKDVILFDKNFELKKEAIEKALLIADEIGEKGDQIKMNYQFNENAKKTYNELLCVVSNMSVADEFYMLAVDSNYAVSPAQIANFKLMCRQDIGLSNKKSKILKHTKNPVAEQRPQQPNYNGQVETPRQMPYSQPAQQPRQVQQMAQTAPQTVPVQPNNVQRSAPQPTQSAQPRPQQPRPMPTNPQAQATRSAPTTPPTNPRA